MTWTCPVPRSKSQRPGRVRGRGGFPCIRSLHESPAHASQWPFLPPTFPGVIGFFFLLAIHYTQINIAGVGLQLPFNASGWVAVSLLLGSACLQIARTKRLAWTPLTVRLAVCAVVLLVPMVYNGSDLRVSTDRFLGLFAGVMVLFAFQQFDFPERTQLKLFLLLVAGIVIEGLIGWAQIISNLQGIDLTPYNNGNPAGVFQQVNNMSSFLVTGLVLSLYVVIRIANRTDETWHWGWLAPALALPLLAVHLLNNLASRAAYLGLAVGFALMLPWVVNHWRRPLVRLWLSMLLLGGGVTVAMESLDDPLVSGIDKPVLTLNSFRAIHFPQSFALFLAQPLQGWGYGNFEGSYVRFTAAEYAEGRATRPPIAGLEHPENELLLWAVEGGVVAIGAVLAAAWFVLQAILRAPLLERLALIGLFFPLVIHSQLEFPFYTSVAHWIAFVMIIYLVTTRVEQRRTLRAEQDALFGVAGVVMPLATTAFMVSTLQSGALLARYEFAIDEDVSSLQAMTNPVVWYDRMLLAVYFRLALNAIANRDPALAQPFIDWAPGFLAHYPRPHHYRYLILAHQAAGDMESALRVQGEARFLFPDQDFTLLDISQLEAVELEDLRQQ